MKQRSILASLILTFVASPLQAAQLQSAGPVEATSAASMGMFAGARIRIALGGTQYREDRVRFHLTTAPVQRIVWGGREMSALRIGNGIEFGITNNQFEPYFSLAGYPLRAMRFAPDEKAPTKGRKNLSNGATVGAIVIGVAALAAGGLLLALDDGGDPDPCTPGECNNN